MGQHKKRFGQHFLHDQNVLTQIVQSIAPQEDDLLIEIGPGAGALTKHLLPALSTLTVIELDRDLIPGLEAIGDQFDATIDIVNEDVLNVDLSGFTKGDVKNLRIVGNLPYNISTPIIFKCLEQAALIKDMYFLMQKEVVDRLTAAPGNKTYGRLSVMVQYACLAEKLFLVSAGAFTPPPKVESALVSLAPYEKPPFPADSYEDFERTVRSAFMHRRKTISNGLKKLLNAEEIESLGIDRKIRPEQLSVEQFVQLSNLVSRTAPIPAR